MENKTPSFLTWALLFVMMEQETGVTPSNPEYVEMWDGFEKQWAELQSNSNT